MTWDDVFGVPKSGGGNVPDPGLATEGVGGCALICCGFSGSTSPSVSWADGPLSTSSIGVAVLHDKIPDVAVGFDT